MQKRFIRLASRRTAVVATALSTLAVAGAVIAPSAQAQAGYRVCPYVNDQGGWMQAPSGLRYHAYVVVKVGKHDICPEVTAKDFKWLDPTMTTDPQPTQQPVAPITCEDHPLYKRNPRIDLCKIMTSVGLIYEFRMYDDGSPYQVTDNGRVGG